MAFGFDRERGVTARGYINISNPVFAPGQRLSRRQYDKYVEQLGARSHAPDVGAIRDAERRLEALREALDTRGAALDAQARELAAREIALAERERAAGARAGFHKERTRGGLRRYRSLLELYQDEQRRKGVRLNKTQAAATPEFKEIIRTIKETDRAQTTKAFRRNPNQVARDLARRKAAFDKVGGAKRFEDDYKERWGYIKRVQKQSAKRASGFGAAYAKTRGR